MKKVGFIVFWLSFACSSFAQFSEDLAKLKEVEVYKPQQKQQFANKVNSNTFYLIGKQLFGFYKGFVSSQDANNCPFSPSCSVYMLQAVEKKGVIEGFLSGMDRLMRCNGSDLDKYPINHETQKLIDPPVNSKKE